MKYGIELRGLDKVIKTTERIEGGDAVLQNIRQCQKNVARRNGKCMLCCL